MALSKIGSDGLSANAVDSTQIADGSVTSGKLASGAAATNLGNYVTTVNGSTGAVTVATSAQGALADSSVQPGDNVSDLTNDSGYLTSSTGVTSVNSTTGAVTVQPTLVSGTNIKTINGTSLLGSGDITVGSSTSFNAVGTYVWGFVVSSGSGQINSGGTVSAGTGYWQLRSINFGQDGNITPAYGNNQNNLSGTWANMSAYMTAAGQNYWWVGLFVRVS